VRVLGLPITVPVHIAPLLFIQPRNENESIRWNRSDYDTAGWRRLIGSPKLQIIVHKRATKYRSLLRKMTYKDKGSYESSPPCIH